MQRHHRHLPGRQILITAILFVGSVLAAHGVVVDAFEGAASPSPWIFSNGPEYPGMTGSLTRGVGHTGNGAHLTFDLSAGGNYVSATDWLPTPVTAGALQLWVKSPGGVQVEVRVNDSTGQTLQYSPNRPLEAGDASQWYLLFVQLGATANYWGGANDGVVHGPITGVTVMALPTLLKVGAIDFDDVQLVAARTTVINPSGVVLAPQTVHDLCGSAGVEITHADATTTGLNLVQTLGFHRIRTEMFWADVETKAGVYNFTWYDQLVASLKTRGLQPHFILCYGNPLYTGTDWMQPPRTTAAITAFGNFARAVASHYARQGMHFEIWNEEDISTYWNPPSAAEYSAMCSVAAAQFHAGDPTTPITSGGLAGMDIGFLDGMIADGGVSDVDAIGIHPYRLEIPEGLAGDLADMRADLAAAFPTDTPPVWSTEAGYSSAWYGDGSLAANRTTQAKYSVRQMLTGLCLNLPVQIFFDLRDTGTNVWDTEENFGVVDTNYLSKPLTAAVQTLLTQCKSHSCLGMLSSPQSATHVLKLQSTSDILLIFWSETVTGTPQTLSVPKPPRQVLDYLGNPLTAKPDGKGNYSVVVGDSPVYVDFLTSTITGK